MQQTKRTTTLKEESTTTYPKNAQKQQLFNEAEKTYHTGDYRAALKLCEKLYVAVPYNIDNLLLLASAHFQLRNLDESIFYNQQILRIDSVCVEAMCNIGNCFSVLGNIDSAVEHYKEAIKVQPRFVIAYSNLASALFHKGFIDEAFQNFTIALTLNPTHLDTIVNFGYVNSIIGKYKEAKKLFLEAIRLEPQKCPIAWSNLGAVLSELNEDDRASECLLQAISLSPSLPDCYCNQGSLLWKKWLSSKRDLIIFNQAVESFQKAIKLKHDFAVAHSNLAMCHFEAGNVDFAHKRLRYALICNPKLVNGLNNLGNLLSFKFDTLEDGIRMYLRALNCRKGDHLVDVFNNLGNAFFKEEWLGLAEKCYYAAIKLNPDFASVLSNISILDMKFHRHHYVEKSTRNCLAAIRIDNACLNAHINLGNIFFETKRIDDALECYEKALEIDKCSFLSRLNLALLYYSNGRVPEALNLFRAAMKESWYNSADEWTSCASMVNYLLILRSTCHWSEYDHYAKEIIGKKFFIHPSQLVILYPYLSQESILRSFRSYSSRLILAKASLSLGGQSDISQNNNNRLKVGYISSNFSNNIMRIFLKFILVMHDQTQFDIIFYSICPLCDRPFSCSLVDLSRMSPFEAAQSIRMNETDVLVSLDGSYKEDIDRILSYQPAKLQIVMFGNLDEAFGGVAWIQHNIFSHQMLLPVDIMVLLEEGELNCNSICNEVAYDYISYDKISRMLKLDAEDGAKDGSEFSLRANSFISEDVFVYAFFGQLDFVEPQMFIIWMDILRKTEDSVLAFRKPSEIAEKNIIKEAQLHGIGHERLVFIEEPIETTVHNHIKLCRCIADLLLDSGTAESGYFSRHCALFAGTPVLFLRNENTFVKQSINELIELFGDDVIFCAENFESYKNIAVDLCLNGERYINSIKKLELNGLQDKTRGWFTEFEGMLKIVSSKTVA